MNLRPATRLLGRLLGHPGACSARCALAALLLACCASVAWAGSKDDHERARAAVQAGEVMPLPALLERLQRTHPGQVLELELDREDGRWIYEVRLLQANGQLLKIELDARTAQVLEVRPREARKDGRKEGRPEGREEVRKDGGKASPPQEPPG